MKVLGLDNKEYTISITKYAFPNRNNVSTGHQFARELLKEFWPFDKALEEVLIPGCKPPLYIDFLVPNQYFGVEVHGRQHFEFVSHFHGNKMNFFKSQARDRRKASWFEMNEIDLIILKTEDKDEWRDQVADYKRTTQGV